jgi:hypothetical protein
MNIFVVQNCPERAARNLCDKHVVKMILESAQMLCGAFPSGEAPYKRAHWNHPCTIWCRHSRTNYEWLLEHGLALADEYSIRYPGKHHKTSEVLKWLKDNKPKIQDLGLTEFAQAMPEQYKSPLAIEAYRKYYVFEKAKFAFWKIDSKIPDWFVQGCLEHNVDYIQKGVSSVSA